MAFQETRNGDHLVWNFQLLFFKIVSKCTKTQRVNAKKSKNFIGKSVSAPATSGHITGNAFTRVSTVVPYVLAIIEASCLFVRLSVRPSHSAIVSKQCRLDHETFI